MAIIQPILGPTLDEKRDLLINLFKEYGVKNGLLSDVKKPDDVDEIHLYINDSRAMSLCVLDINYITRGLHGRSSYNTGFVWTRMDRSSWPSSIKGW